MSPASALLQNYTVDYGANYNIYTEAVKSKSTLQAEKAPYHEPNRFGFHLLNLCCEQTWVLCTGVQVSCASGIDT